MSCDLPFYGVRLVEIDGVSIQMWILRLGCVKMGGWAIGRPPPKCEKSNLKIWDLLRGQPFNSSPEIQDE